MKIKKCLTRMICLIFVIFLLTACTGEQQESAEFMSTASNILVNSKSPNAFSFNVALFSKEEITQIDCIGLEGANINSDDYTVNIIDNNIDILNSYKYKGYYIKYIMVEIAGKSSNENCTIENLVLNVDGTLQRLKFSTPVNHILSEGNVFTEELQISYIPNEFSSSMINNGQEDVTYEFHATEDVLLQDIRFEDFLSVSNVVYAIGNQNPHEARFPIRIKKGQNIRITLSFTSDTANEFDYVATNMYFDYLTMSKNEKYFNSVYVIFDPVYPIGEDDTTKINEMIDHLK